MTRHFAGFWDCNAALLRARWLFCMYATAGDAATFLYSFPRQDALFPSGMGHENSPSLRTCILVWRTLRDGRSGDRRKKDFAHATAYNLHTYCRSWLLRRSLAQQQRLLCLVQTFSGWDKVLSRDCWVLSVGEDNQHAIPAHCGR